MALSKTWSKEDVIASEKRRDAAMAARGPQKQQTVVLPPSGLPTPKIVQAPSNPKGGGGGGGGGGISSAQAALNKANAEAKGRSDRENANTRALADQQFSLLAGFGKSRDIKLGNIQRAMEGADRLLLEGYANTLGALGQASRSNEAAEGDASFSNIANALRERGEILGEAASQGAGETDLLRSQLQALRNYDTNQNEVNRSFFDTLRSINSSITSLNSDTATSRANLFNQAESDRESTWANYYNQVADTWTQIGNVENANNNTSTDSTNAYNKAYSQAGSEAANAVGSAYQRAAIPAGWTEWQGKGKTEERDLTNSNRAAVVNLGGPQKRAEGATLRKW